MAGLFDLIPCFSFKLRENKYTWVFEIADHYFKVECTRYFMNIY